MSVFFEMTYSYLRMLNGLKRLQDHLTYRDIALAGAFHHGNAGDMALAFAILRASQVDKHPLRLQIQNIYRLNHLRIKPYCIVGGGSILTAKTIPLMINRYRRTPRNCFILGVDCHIDEDHVITNSEFFSSLGMLTFRNKNQIEAIRNHKPEIIIGFQPDICFALPQLLRLPEKDENGKGKTFGINIREGSGEAASGYFHIVRSYAELAANEGYRLVHIPFTPKDDLVAKKYLYGFAVLFLPYTPDVTAVIKRVNACNLFFASCFHAKIFAYVTRTPCIPYFYAPKDYWLHKDLSLHDHIRHFYGIYERDFDIPDSLRDSPVASHASLFPEHLIRQLGCQALAPVLSTFGKIKALAAPDASLNST